MREVALEQRNHSVAEDDEDSAVIGILRTPKLSIKYLDEDTRERLRAFILKHHIQDGESLGDIAKLIGSKTSGYTSWLARELGVQPRSFEEARLKGIREKRRKYERKPFDGTETDRTYLLGIRHGDYSVCRPFGGAIRVSTSTTHPTMTQLFKDLFQEYGHVYVHPRYKKDTETYEWNLSAILDDSFEFMLQEHPDVKGWIEQTDERFYSYLSGLLDADGSIILTKDNHDMVYVFVDFYNSDLPILEWIQGQVKKRGYFASLRLNKPRGRVTKKWKIIHRRDYYQLSIYGMDHIHVLLGALRPRHPEKVLRNQIASSTRKGQLYAEIQPALLTLATDFDEERRLRLEGRKGVQEQTSWYPREHLLLTWRRLKIQRLAQSDSSRTWRERFLRLGDLDGLCRTARLAGHAEDAVRFPRGI